MARDQKKGENNRREGRIRRLTDRSEVMNIEKREDMLLDALDVLTYCSKQIVSLPVLLTVDSCSSDLALIYSPASLSNTGS